jgi:hypothetical protein
MAKRTEAARPRIRTPMANSLGTLTSKRAVAHNAVPAAKDGALAARVPAVPESITPSPMANTKKPAATISLPLLKNFKPNKLVAITRPAPSIAHDILRTFASATNVPAMPNTAPRAMPMAATMFNSLGLVELIRWTAGATLVRKRCHYTSKSARVPLDKNEGIVKGVVCGVFMNRRQIYFTYLRLISPVTVRPKI